ncbi:hypothetical protein F2P81_024645 [Scophthalmus maximus]|uniref:Uncharacterized protein n=1 Tax=Scophthalmus maximus TaxID=52904 RepID=A0A6A4RUW8_SCOMX|nr:hypothetical protein F2P81_024645 [Scophthalmus maximus]
MKPNIDSEVSVEILRSDSSVQPRRSIRIRTSATTEGVEPLPLLAHTGRRVCELLLCRDRSAAPPLHPPVR